MGVGIRSVQLTIVSLKNKQKKKIPLIFVSTSLFILPYTSNLAGVDISNNIMNVDSRELVQF